MVSSPSRHESPRLTVFGAAAMSDSFRMFTALAIGLIAFYWIFVVVVRVQFGIELPDPADLLPASWRHALPRGL